MMTIETPIVHTDDQPMCIDPTCPCQGVLDSGPILAVGDVNPSVLEWLEKRGATIIDGGAVTVVALPERAILERKVYDSWWDYRVSFYDDDGVEIAPGLFYELCEDARLSRLGFRRDAA